MAFGAKWLTTLENWLSTGGVSATIVSIFIQLALCGLIAALAVLTYRLVTGALERLLTSVVTRTRVTWDDELLKTPVVKRLAHLAPMIVIRVLGDLIFPETAMAAELLRGVVQLYLIVVVVGTLSAALDFGADTVLNSKHGDKFPIKGITQAIKLIAVLISLILALSVLLGKSPAYLLSGIGALTAILMLIFKDAILGFTAGIMLAANRLVSLGDWIEMPAAGADGSVVDISLTTVQVQNFDKTIISIPAYDLVSKSFKNWRGMVNAGGRRIKRAIHIDMQSVRFADKEMLEHWRKIELLRPYLLSKLSDIERSNQELQADLSVLGNGRRLTNLGTFRAYCEAYLHSCGGIHGGMLTMVRQLAPTEHGLPLEIYTFTDKTDWLYYEGVQSDIFDHLLAIIGEFGLAVYQRESDAEKHA